MKPILLLVLACAGTVHAVESFRKEFGFDVARADAPNGAAYTWPEAVEVCRTQGAVLPSPGEMATIYCHARLKEKHVSPEHPQTDKGCGKAGVSETFENFVEKGRYWTSSRYNDGVMRYFDFSDGGIGYQGKEERLNVRCVMSDEAGQSAELPDAVPYDINDMDKASFDFIADAITRIYAGPLKEAGKELRISKQWGDAEESARSWFMEDSLREANRVREVREIELIGGLARHPMLNRDAFALVVCHEIGHHLGGAPVALGYSAEGQADYFATSKCMKRYLKRARYAQASPEALPESLQERCAESYGSVEDREICRRNILAALTLSRWFAHMRDTVPTDLSRRDRSLRDSTLVHGYPSPQCRLDTMVAGALCPVDPHVSFSDDNPQTGACTRTDGYELEARPRCWFNPEEPAQQPSAPSDSNPLYEEAGGAATGGRRPQP